ncbi:MAG: AAA family ATPase [Acidobacteria bacterium]|nr:AAA family ATPase [Acidobacteriota bacterium]
MPKARLVELYARGVGVIDEARIEFGSGFNVLTGETGAGKTLLLGALELCLGGDAAASRYAVTPTTRTVAVFAREDDAEVVLARESSSSGRLRASIDASPSSAEVLRQVAAQVIVIHGQHDSLSLRSRHEILRIIDAAGNVDVSELESLRREVTELTSQRDALGGDGASREREREYLLFQLRELRAAAIEDATELERTLEELRRLSRLADAQEVLLDVIDELDGDRDDAILSQWARANQRLPRDTGLDDLRDALTELLDQARANVHELHARARPDLFDPARIADLESRASTLQTIARKYGGSLEAAITEREDIERRLEELANAQDRLGDLDARLEELVRREHELSATARRERESACEFLTRRVNAQLPRVALASAVLRFEVHGEDGADARLLFTPNPGWPEGPLQALASGGELSRVLLALSLETAHEDVVAVFDEVDAGVGGQVAQQIGECLREVGERQQVIAVTHLASVAAKAAHHFVIEKTVADGITTTRVRRVTGEERVREIARMLAGDVNSEEAGALARRLLESAA